MHVYSAHIHTCVNMKCDDSAKDDPPSRTCSVFLMCFHLMSVSFWIFSLFTSLHEAAVHTKPGVWELSFLKSKLLAAVNSFFDEKQTYAGVNIQVPATTFSKNFICTTSILSANQSKSDNYVTYLKWVQAN